MSNSNNSSELMVTIRCLVYNHEPYLRQCLDGFVMQKTDFRFEAIVHDDASTDGSAAIIQEYAAKYPDIIKPILETENQYIKKDGSLTRIMNEHTRGKYIALCEGDDYWVDPLKLQKQVHFLEEHPDYVLSYTNRTVVNEENKRLLSNNPRGKSGLLFDYLLFKGNPITTASTCFRYDAYMKARQTLTEMNLKGISMGDFPLWIIMSQFGKFHYINEKSVVYRILKNSASHSSNNYKKIVKFGQDERMVKQKLYAYFCNKTADEIFEKEYYKILIRKMAQYDLSVFLQYYKEGTSKYSSLLFNPKLLLFYVMKRLRCI